MALAVTWRQWSFLHVHVHVHNIGDVIFDTAIHNEPLRQIFYHFSLSQIAFWLLENDLRVMIAACDTFRSGAVEQLRTHARRLNHHHPGRQEGGPDRLLLFERGYGKDPAGIAMEAIHVGKEWYV